MIYPDTNLAHAATLRSRDLLLRSPALATVAVGPLGSAALAALEPAAAAAAWRYGELPVASLELVQALQREHGESVAANGLRWLLLQAVGSFEARFAASDLPPVFHAEFVVNLRRILDDYGTDNELPAPSLTNDSFLKDLAVARLLLVPCASHVIHRHSGVPRRALARVRSLGGALDVARVVLGRAGGFQPFLENHVHMAMLNEFTPQGRERCMRMVAALLLAWPDSRGLMGTSWYYDPQVSRYSPRLAYLRQDPASRGACFIDMGPHPQATGSALSRSPTRRAAHAKGLYQPRNYMMIWSRQDILRHYQPAEAST